MGMAIITKMRKQKAVYWANKTPDGLGGYVFDPPVEIDCRWEGKQELFVDEKGEQALSRAVVYVDRDMSVGEYLLLGTLDDLEDSSSSGSSDPTKYEEAWPIRSFEKLPTLKADQFLRTVHL